ncbi:hypothetical protein Lgra_2346 [Legionella gratiana]|uniref:Uncharacterized protein n=1 Tax=Legionella gratiana TaxID=45066 RepID=A0A378JEB3_9GAMM|nr:hypothetical protein [Legionella gratiana]KTD09111.1 hypothetical protein Lgra_2346 [Legionella gratiana]STX45676.1 Uncharacterised protein [Legionella gratiana]
MKIVVFSSCSNNFGDLAFGKRIGLKLRDKYPKAEISLVTDPKDSPRGKQAKAHLEKINLDSKFPIIPIDDYQQNYRYDVPADLIIIGPVLNIKEDLVINILAKNNPTVPIVLMTEYNFDDWVIRDLNDKIMRQKGFSGSILDFPTGINNLGGIFIENQLVDCDLTKDETRQNIFNKLTQTSNIILGNASSNDYINNTNIAVNYSHNNARRFLTVHSLIVSPVKNVDVINLGDKNQIDKTVLKEQSEKLLQKGFSKVIYASIEDGSEVVAQTNNNGPIYRVIHTGMVSADESLALRQLCGDFGGATGDQSYSEAISKSSIVVYECQTWKKGFLDAMVALGNTIDASGKLGETIRLLGTADSEEKYVTLSSNLRDENVLKGLHDFRLTILKNHDLSINLKYLDDFWNKDLKKKLIDQLSKYSSQLKSLHNHNDIAVILKDLTDKIDGRSLFEILEHWKVDNAHGFDKNNYEVLFNNKNRIAYQIKSLIDSYFSKSQIIHKINSDDDFYIGIKQSIILSDSHKNQPQTSITRKSAQKYLDVILTLVNDLESEVQNTQTNQSDKLLRLCDELKNEIRNTFITLAKENAMNPTIFHLIVSEFKNHATVKLNNFQANSSNLIPNSMNKFDVLKFTIQSSVNESISNSKEEINDSIRSSNTAPYSMQQSLRSNLQELRNEYIQLENITPTPRKNRK